MLELKEEEQTFTFEWIPSEPIPSLLRDFSAPVKLRMEYTDDDLAFLMKYDTDSFNRWEAGQKVGNVWNTSPCGPRRLLSSSRSVFQVRHEPGKIWNGPLLLVADGRGNKVMGDLY